jgi:hypothetical protein
VIVFPPPVVLPEEDLDASPRGLDRICVVAGVWTDEVDAVGDIAVHVTLTVEITVRTPAINDDCSDGFDPGMYDGHQCVSGSVWYGNKKRSAGPSFNIAKHPLTLNTIFPQHRTYV